MKSNRTVIIVSGLSHALAWLPFLWLALWPYSYSGTATIPIGPDGSGGESVSLSASIIEINGWRVLIPLLIHVALTAIGLLAAITWNHQLRNKVFLWVATVLLIGFCGLGMLSIGIFYLPAALALLVGAITMSLIPRGFPLPY